MIGSIRYPNITGATEAAQLMQVKSYLHQLVDQLNISMAEVETSVSATASAVVSAASNAPTEKEAQSTFNAVKSLIIKSADIVNAYYEEINERLEGVYVAESAFGTYKEETSQDIAANSKNITQLFSNEQTIISRVDGIENQMIDTNAYIKSGELYTDDNGVPIYGVEVGQTVEIDGDDVFNKFARFTADKLAFYDQNGDELAYISGTKLYITHAQITGSFVLGGFEDTVRADGDVVTKWVGNQTTGGGN